MGGLLFGTGMGGTGRVGDDGAGKQACGCQSFMISFFSLFWLSGISSLFFSIFSFVHRLVYFIFHSFCLFFFPQMSSSNQSLIHIPGR